MCVLGIVDGRCGALVAAAAVGLPAAHAVALVATNRAAGSKPLHGVGSNDLFKSLFGLVGISDQVSDVKNKL